MTGNAIKSEALEPRDLSSEELDAVSGGRQQGQNDPAQMFQQILQQLTQQG
jgi:hypothetical protein